MAAKPKMTPEEWASARAAWEADPRKALSWLVDELGLPVSGEALRLRAKADGWVKGGVGPDDSKLAEISKLGKEKSKLGESINSKLAPEIPSLEDGAQAGAEDKAGALVDLSKTERESGAMLTPSEERFASEYLIDLNATQAYRRVFPDVTDGSARTLGARLLAKVDIAERVAALKNERASRTGITSDRVPPARQLDTFMEP